MGEVYRARDSRLDRDVAIKVLPKLVSADSDRLRRFEIEAKAAAALNHPNILAVFQMGTYAGVPYLVSELLEGKTLAETVRRGPLPLRLTISYGVQIAHGLAAAHEKGIVHRDLKPDNIFVTKDGRIKILDFGLAKLTQPKESVMSLAPTITMQGVAMGTAGYMSPEQVRGLAVDHRTDIFAFGAILYEMLMGKPTFGRPTSADTMSAILNEEPDSISDLAPETPAALQRVVLRCLEKNAEQRFQSASDLAFALESLSGTAVEAPTGAHAIQKEHGKETDAKPQSGKKEDSKRSDEKKDGPNRSLTIFVAAALVIVALLVAYFWMQPAAMPRVGNYVQLTHDGQPKSLIGTDGSRTLPRRRRRKFRKLCIPRHCGDVGIRRRAAKDLSHALSRHDPRGLVAGWIGDARRGRTRRASARTTLEPAHPGRLPTQACGCLWRNRRMVSRWQDAGIQQSE